MGNGDYVSWSQFKEFQDEQNEHGNRLTAIETQLKRIVSDIESEKGARARMNGEALRQLELERQVNERRHGENERRMQRIERAIYVGTGIMLTITAILHYIK